MRRYKLHWFIWENNTQTITMFTLNTEEFPEAISKRQILWTNFLGMFCPTPTHTRTSRENIFQVYTPAVYTFRGCVFRGCTWWVYILRGWFVHWRKHDVREPSVHGSNVEASNVQGSSGQGRNGWEYNIYEVRGCVDWVPC